MEILIRDARFWVVLLLFAKAVLYHLLPEFPESIWMAFDALIATVLAILAGNNLVQTKRAAVRATGAAGK
jgi:hypothetical protein